jgi:prepilin signal peptidase PulO-like enzyme (type II secretory pathway)
MPLQLLVVMLIAACFAGQLNRGIYRLARTQRSISPWSASPAGLSARNWLDRIPVLGWWRLRRESSVHGQGFWLRPALIEAAFIIGLGALYAFELQGGLLPIGAIPPPASVLRAQFVNHACLIGLLIVAVFIDLDEKTIPDEITLPGTLLAVLLAGLLPQAALPAWAPAPPPIVVVPLRLSAPADWRPEWDGRLGWTMSNACILGWWYALLPKTLWYRSGVRKFVRYLWASLVRRRFSPRLTAVAIAAAGGTAIAWRHGGAVWQSVLSAWVGMAVGGVIVWLVRIVASWALRQEAMGFGDVTLMAMIGAFLGWQPALLVFFLAPFTGVVVAVSQWVVTRKHDLAFGPYLGLAALLVVVTWASAWRRWGYPVFSLGSLVLAALMVSLLLLAAILWAIQRVKRISTRTRSR